MTDQEEDREIARIKAALGDGIGHYYVIELLKKDDLELLSWLRRHVVEMIPSIDETLHHVDCLDAGVPGADGSARDLGYSILLSRFRLAAFIVQELQRKAGAIDVVLSSDAVLPPPAK
jgi:hypothetical protein